MKVKVISTEPNSSYSDMIGNVFDVVGEKGHNYEIEYPKKARCWVQKSYCQIVEERKLPFKTIIPRKDGAGFIGRVLTEEVTVQRKVGLLDIADADQANGRPLTARVLMVSDWVTGFQVGDIVQHSRQIASSFTHKGVKYTVIEETNIFGVIDTEEMPINE